MNLGRMAAHYDECALPALPTPSGQLIVSKPDIRSPERRVNAWTGSSANEGRQMAHLLVLELPGGNGFDIVSAALSRAIMDARVESTPDAKSRQHPVRWLSRHAADRLQLRFLATNSNPLTGFPSSVLTSIEVMECDSNPAAVNDETRYSRLWL